MKKIHKFDQDWFAKQFGKRPGTSLFSLNQEIEDTERKLKYLKNQLFEAEIYLAKEDAALKTFVKTVFQVKGEK